MAQVRLIFRPVGYNERQVYAYVDWFSKVRWEPSIDMFIFKRVLTRAGTQKSGVVRLEAIKRQIQLIPKFGIAVDEHTNKDNVLDGKRDQLYYLNSFWTKQTYINVF